MFRKISFALLTYVTSVGVANATTWDLAKDFNLSANPSGAWSYGYKVGKNFKLYGSTYTLASGGYSGDRGAAIYWGGPQQSGSVFLPHIAFFVGQAGYDVNLAGAIKEKSGGVTFHPGDGASSVARWTAPADGAYNVQATFTNADVKQGATTLVSVNKNVENLFSNLLSGLTGLRHYATSDSGIALKKGDVLEFVVDPNGALGYDATGVDAVIKNVDARK